MKSLISDYKNTQIENTYIITIPNNNTSLEFANRCAKSCESVDQKYVLWEAFDGTDSDIKIPKNLETIPHIYWPKLINIQLMLGQVACFMSHYSLWCRCLTLDQPLVILEHDAIMIQKFDKHFHYNSIIYLGNQEQYKNGWTIDITPPFATDHNGNVRSLCRAHAYSIDPSVAKKLVAEVLQYGIYTSLDMFIKADIFPIFQFGLYAYDDPDIKRSTIHGTKISGDYFK